jgi:hypothetical protein
VLPHSSSATTKWRSSLGRIPSFWSGTLALTAQVNPNGSPTEANLANNAITEQVTFEDVPRQFLVMYKVGYDVGGTTYYPSDIDRAEVVVWLRRAYPVSDVRVVLRSYFHGTGVPECGDVNTVLAAKRLADLASSTDIPVNARYYGLISDGGAGGTLGGCAAGIPAFVASGGTGTAGLGYDDNGSYAAWVGDHELGHEWGRFHAEYCGASGGRPYPYGFGNISPTRTGPNALYGFDIVSRALYGPEWKDFMTYCAYKWVSDFTYHGLLDLYESEAGAAAAESSPADRMLVVGTIDPQTNTVDLRPIFTLPDALESKTRIPGPYAIVLRNEAGTELARYPFTPDTGVVDPPFGPGAAPAANPEILFINELVP